MIMKEIKHITLKGNPALKDLSKFLDKTPDEVREKIITSLLNYGYITDKIQYCGYSLEEILRNHRETIEGFSKHCFKASYDKLLTFLEGIIIWGVNHDCPQCGCETHIIENEKTCIRCNFSISLVPEKNCIKANTLIYLN